MKAQSLNSLLRQVRSFYALSAAVILVTSNATAQSGNADLVISFTNSTAAATLGQYFTCTVRIYNAGWVTAMNTVVTNQLPPGLQFVSVTSSRGVCTQAAGAVTWSLGNFPQYNSATMTMEFKAVTVGTHTNLASAVSSTPDPDLASNHTNFVTLVTAARFFAVDATHALYYNTPSLTLLTNNQVLVVGQHLGTTTDLYNPASRTFNSPSGTMVGPHETGSATLLTNGLVLLVGGGNATGAKIAEVYNPATQLFRRVGDPLVYSYDHYATLQSDGSVVLCGGGMTTNELFNPVTETFSLAPTRQCAFNGIYLSTGKFLYFGYGRAYLYDTNPATSVETSGFLQPRSYHSATPKRQSADRWRVRSLGSDDRPAFQRGTLRPDHRHLHQNRQFDNNPGTSLRVSAA